MNCSAAILRQQAALSQAERLSEMAPELEALRAQNASLHQQLEVRTKRIAELQAALQAAQRAAHRQAAPFRLEPQKRAVAPKPPGRKHGHPGAFRHNPEQIDEHIEVQLYSCPHCGGAQFKDQHTIEQLIEDIPPVRPHVTRLTTYQATCLQCGHSLRSTHPLQMSLAIGAAGVQLGPRALALAADLNKAKGLLMRKTCAVLHDCFSLQLSPGGLSQALDRLATKVKPQYDAKGVRGRAPVNLPDLETLLVHFSLLVAEQRWIKEIDVNPLLASPTQILALDARIVLHGPELSENQLPRLAIRPYPEQYVTQWKPRDGTPLTIRPIRPEDEPLMVKFHGTLSEESVHFRYFGIVKLEQRVAHERLTRICFNNYDREIAMVATRQATKEEEILGVGRLIKVHGVNESEFAIVISDQWQGQGLGTYLLKLLLDIGRKEGLERIIGHILPDNYGMQRVCKKLGFALNYDDFADDMRAEITL